MQPSSYLLFARKIRGRHWSRRMIMRKFMRQVEKDDYEKKDRARILDYLYSLSTESQ